MRKSKHIYGRSNIKTNPKHKNDNRTLAESNGFLEITSELGNKLDIQIESLQYQLNIISKYYVETTKELEYLKMRNLYLESELNKINNTLSIGTSLTTNDPNKSYTSKYVFGDPMHTHTFTVTDNVKQLFISAIGGGGAGGIGCIKDMYYYNGGGGGAASCIINKPIEVMIGTILNISIGRGGCPNECRDGGDTVINITHPDGTTDMIVIKGGTNGHPRLKGNLCANRRAPASTDDFEPTLNVDGGSCGESCISILKGGVGQNGSISLPSYTSAQTGTGGSSIFAMGGKGGNITPLNSKNPDINFSHNLLGENGKYGSGGGGSVAKYSLDLSKPLAGLGGDGFVVIDI